MMRILILLKKWQGGVGVVTNGLKKELERRGHFVKIISREGKFGSSSLVSSFSRVRSLIKSEMKNGDFDVIYTQDWSLALPLILPKPIFEKKHFCCFHGIQNGAGSFFQKFVAKFLKNRLIVVGPSLKRKFHKAHLIYNCVDPNLYKPLKKTKRIKNSVGFANWCNENYRFKEIKSAIENVGRRMIIAKDRPQEEMVHFYNQIETLISLPPSFTGFGLVWIEAMACGVPRIIGNNFGIGSELPIDKVEDYGSIEKVLLNSKKRDYREMLGDKFSWGKNVNTLVEIWDRN